MNKQEFLLNLRNLLSGLPEKDIEERLSFYGEMIDDRVSEEKITEEEAVSLVGSVEEIASQIIIETPVLKIAKEKIKKGRRFSLWEILVIALGSPIWLSLLIAVFAVVFAVYISAWAIIISLWAVFVSVLASGFGITAFGFVNLFTGNPAEGIAMIGVGIAAVGLSIFVFYGCKMVTKGFIWLTKKIVLGIKNCFRNKGEAK